MVYQFRDSRITHRQPASAAALRLAALRHACAVLDNGTVKCWGSNDYGALGTAAAYTTIAPTTAWSVRWLAFSVATKLRSLRARASVRVLA